MSDPTRPPASSDRLRRALTAEGFAPDVADSLMALDAANFQFVRRVQKGDVPNSLMREIGAGIEAVQFHALSAILRIEQGHARRAQEVTVGLLAEEMQVDPSRASRIAADLVDRGLIARAVSQQDGRRSVLVPTPAGRAVVEKFLHAKWRRIAAMFRDWPADEVQSFARLFARYSEGMSRAFSTGSEGE
ncbi:MAG: MarR family transcriptional regulator [Paracoccaceae bacterium]